MQQFPVQPKNNFSTSGLSWEEWKEKQAEERDEYGIYGMSRKELIQFAREMGRSDSWRGLQQIGAKASGDDETIAELKFKNDKLMRVLAHPEHGTRAALAFFSNAMFLDAPSYVPYAGWAKKLKTAKNFKDFFKYGAYTGASVGAMGYTPEDHSLFIDSLGEKIIGEDYNESPWLVKKGEQIGVSSIFGGGLSAGGAKLTDMYLTAYKGKSIFDRAATVVDDSTDAAVKPTNIKNKKDLSVGDPVFLKDRNNQGQIISVDSDRGVAVVRIVNSKTGKGVKKEFYLDDLKGLPNRSKAKLEERDKLFAGWIINKKKNGNHIYTLHDAANSGSKRGKNNLEISNRKKFNEDISYQIKKLKDGYTVFKNIIQSSVDDSVKPWTQNTKLQTFKTLREAKNFVHNQVNPEIKPKGPTPKIKDIELLDAKAGQLSDPKQTNLSTSLEKIWRTLVDEDLGPLLWNKLANNPVESLGGAIGGWTGYMTIDEDDDWAAAAAKISSGAMLGYGGTYTLKYLSAGTYQAIAANIVDGYGLTNKYTNIKKQTFEFNRNKIENDFNNLHLRATKELDDDGQKILYQIMHGDYTSLSKIGSEGIKLSKDTRKILKELGQELVDLGALNPKTFKQMQDKYFRRVYLGKTANRAEKEFASNMKVLGDALKPRGPAPKTVLKARYESKWKNEGYYIVDEVGKNKVKIRRDYTKEQREQMGEIENFSYGLNELGRILSNDIASLKFFKAIKDEFSIDAATFNKLSLDEQKLWVRIGDDTVKGTKIKKYGELSGRYVDQFVYNDLHHTFQAIQINKSGKAKDKVLSFFDGAYDDVLRIWKKTKTAWNLGTHVANTLSNIMLIDFAGTKLSYVGKALKEMKKGQSSKIWQEAKIHGGMGGDLVTNELRKTNSHLDRKLRGLRDDLHPIDMTLDGLRAAWNKKYNPFRVITFTADKMEELYQLEDQVFRLAIYMDRLDKGFSKSAAAADAKKWIIDYDISAPLISGRFGLKRTVAPFISYTYRVLPLLAEGSLKRPTALAKWGAIGYATQGIGQWFMDDEEQSKLNLQTQRDNEKRRMWGLPFMPSVMWKLPIKSANGEAMYIDMTRWTPGGDIFDIRHTDGLSVPFLPSPLQPGGPLVDFAWMYFTGTDPFTTDKIKDWDNNRGVATFKHFFSHQLPNMPGVGAFGYLPKSYATEKVLKNYKLSGEIKEDLSFLGVEDWENYTMDQVVGLYYPSELQQTFIGSEYSVPYSPIEAIFYGFGFKIKPIDYRRNAKIQLFEMTQEYQNILTLQNNLKKDWAKGNALMSYEEYEKKVDNYEMDLLEVSTRIYTYMNTIRAKELKIDKIQADKINKELYDAKLKDLAEIKSNIDTINTGKDHSYSAEEIEEMIKNGLFNPEMLEIKEKENPNLDAIILERLDEIRREEKEEKNRKPLFSGGLISEDHPVSDVTKRPSSRKNKYTKEPFLKERTEEQMDSLLDRKK